MLLFPNAKINLGLNILGKRSDGFHNIETCFFPVNWNDVLEIIPSGDTQLFLTGKKMDGKKDENLCMKAYQLLAGDYDLPPVTMYLHKIIPTGAGLGGGSSDAAFMLKGLNEFFSIGLDNVQLSYYAGLLGSDVNFFINNIVSLASGRGNEMESFSLTLENYYLVLIYPGINCSTQEAYKNVKSYSGYSLKEHLLKPVSQWKDNLTNSFEEWIFIKFPEIKKIKETLYSMGAIYSSLSGSGSTVYGIFEQIPENLPSFFPERYEIHIQKRR